MISIYTERRPPAAGAGSLLESGSLEEIETSPPRQPGAVTSGRPPSSTTSRTSRTTSPTSRPGSSAPPRRSRPSARGRRAPRGGPRGSTTSPSPPSSRSRASSTRPAPPASRPYAARAQDRTVLRALKDREASIQRQLVAPRPQPAQQPASPATPTATSATPPAARHLALRLPDAPDLRLLQPAQRHRLRHRLRRAAVRLGRRHRHQHLLRLGLRQPPLPVPRPGQRQEPGADLQPPLGLPRLRRRPGRARHHDRALRHHRLVHRLPPALHRHGGRRRRRPHDLLVGPRSARTCSAPCGGRSSCYGLGA